MKSINYKKTGNKPVRNFTFILILLCSISFSNRAFSQNTSLSELTVNKYALQNLKVALSSDNYGIKRCAIYLIGKYKIAEGENIIEEMLVNEKDPCNKILAALVLMELNETKGITALKKMAKTDLNEEAKKMALFTFYQHLINDTGIKKVNTN